MRVIIAGGRNFNDRFRLLRAIVASGFEITEEVSGRARGADRLGEEWAHAKGIPVKAFPADWEQHGKSAGVIRNRQMAEYADALIALPGGRGTENMVSEANKRGLKVFVG